MPSLKPGQLRIEIFAKPSDLGGWPASWFVIFDGSVDEAKMAAKSALDLGIWPLAESFEITDHESQIQYKWPETD